MAHTKRITALRPTWNHAPAGQVSGVTFLCPECPKGSCEITLRWEDPKPHENVASLEHLTLGKMAQGSRPGCQVKGKIEHGHIHWEHS